MSCAEYTGHLFLCQTVKERGAYGSIFNKDEESNGMMEKTAQ
jgi:hypothetical protein